MLVYKLFTASTSGTNTYKGNLEHILQYAIFKHSDWLNTVEQPIRMLNNEQSINLRCKFVDRVGPSCPRL